MIGNTRIVLSEFLRFPIPTALMVILVQLTIYETARADDQELKPKLVAQVSTTEHICRNDQLLNAFGLDSDKCRIEVTRHSTECWEIADPLMPDVTIEGNEIQNFEQFASLSMLFSMCVQSRMLMSKLYSDSVEERLRSLDGQ